MKNKKAVKARAAFAAAQQHLPFGEIKKNTIVMKDGTLRAVLKVSSINFALKNEDEQNAIVGAYVSFLNTLEHPLQIVIQSRKLNIAPYLEELGKRERTQANELLRVQTADYRSFVAQMVELGEIMNKTFYVVVPYDPLSDKKRSFWSRLMEVINPTKIIQLKDDRFDRRRHDLDMRVRQIESGLRGMGLEVAPLDTQALIELMYSTFNTDIALSESLPDIDKIQLEGK